MRFSGPANLTLTNTILALALIASFYWLSLPYHSSVAIGGSPDRQSQHYEGSSTPNVWLGEKTEYVDLIELNHFIDDEGRQVFRQLVFYDWSDLDKRFQVRAWRLVKNDRQLPRRFWKPDRYECHWHDGGQRKIVSAKQLQETWSQQDPERTNRKYLPEGQRIPLFTNH
jgi:hypothetical protein